MKLRFVIAAALAVTSGFAVAAPAAGAAGLSPGQIISAVNAERSANGIPGDLTEDPRATSDCRAHDQYAEANGGYDAGNAHGESKSNATQDGKFGGGNSVLASGAPWSDGDPWRSAPYHLLSVYDPKLMITGADESGSAPFDCLWTSTNSPPVPDGSGGYLSHSTARPNAAQSTIYSYPGDGVTGAPWYEYEYESPQVPEYTVGLTNTPTGSGTPRGRSIFVYWDGPVDATHDELPELCAGSVTGPGGQVATHLVPASLSGLVGPDRGIILPEEPLKPSTTYSVAASFGAGGCPATPRFSKTFSFTTAAQRPVTDYVRVDDPQALPNAGMERIAWRIDDPLIRGTGTISFSSNYIGNNPDFGFWQSGYIDIPKPGPGQSFTLTLRNDPFTIGSTTWSATSVSPTFAGPAGANDGGSDNGGGSNGGTGGNTAGGQQSTGAKTVVIHQEPGSGGPVSGASVAGSQKLGRAVVGYVTLTRGGSTVAGRVLGDSRLVRSARLAVIGSRTKRGVGAGTFKVVVPIKAKVRRRLRRKRSVKVTLKIVVTPPSGGPVTITRPIRLKR